MVVRSSQLSQRFAGAQHRGEAVADVFLVGVQAELRVEVKRVGLTAHGGS